VDSDNPEVLTGSVCALSARGLPETNHEAVSSNSQITSVFRCMVIHLERYSDQAAGHYDTRYWHGQPKEAGG